MNVEHDSGTEVHGQSPSGIQSQSPWSRGKPERILHLHNLSSWPVCPKKCFFAKQKILSNMSLPTVVGSVGGLKSVFEE